MPPQALNKARALEMIKAKLLVVAQEQQLQEIAQIRGDLVKAGVAGGMWGGVWGVMHECVWGGVGWGRRAGGAAAAGGRRR